MKEGFLSYWYSLWTDIPLWFYEAGASILCIVVVLSISIWGFLRCSKYGLAVLLALTMEEQLPIVLLKTQKLQQQQVTLDNLDL